MLSKDQFLERQERVVKLADVPNSVTVAMDCWVHWMGSGEGCRGYPRKAACFASGGLNSVEDMDSEARSFAARAVDGAVNSLAHVDRTCIGIIWLGHTIHFRRVDVEDRAIEAMRLIYHGLVMRGVA